MSGRRSGVATQIQQLEPRVLYMHCMGHCLNLAVQDCHSIKIMRDAFDTILELSKNFKYSAKKKATLIKCNQSFLHKFLVSSYSVQLVGQYVLNHFDLFYLIMKLFRQINNIDRKVLKYYYTSFNF